MGLSLFAVTFVRLTSIERSATSSYMHKLEARSIARAGLHRAISELRNHYKTKAFDDSRKSFSAGTYRPNDPWCYYDRYYRDAFYVNNANSADQTKQKAPLGLTLTPNISYRNEAQINTMKVDLQRSDMTSKQAFYISGNMGLTPSGGLKNYRLKILDCASMLYVNNPDSNVLERMLKNLLRARFHLNANAATDIAKRVSKRRPSGGYLTKEQIGLVIRDRNSGNSAKYLSDTQWELIKDDLTCFAWTDNKVILPPLTKFTTRTHSTVTSLGSQEVNDPSIKASLIMTERAPVNINTASLPVLISVFAEIEGVITELKRNYTHGDAQSNVTMNVIKTVTIDFNEATNLAKKVLQRRHSQNSGPFRSWFEFETWLDTTAMNSIDAQEKDLIKAMVNPNTDIAYHKFASEGNHNYRWILNDSGTGFLPSVTRVLDKTDLTQMTTELCFASMGWFEITSLGQIWKQGEITGSGSNQRVLLKQVQAEQSVQTVVRVYDLLRLTTQRDFERDRVYSDPKMFLNYAQDATTKPGSGYLSHGFTDLADPPSDLGLVYAWPATLTQPEYTNRHILPSSQRNRSTASFSNGANRRTVDPYYSLADYDGNIILNGLSKMKTVPNDFLVGFSRGSLRPIKTRVHKTERGLKSGPKYNGKSKNEILAYFERVGSDKVLNKSTKVRTKNPQGLRSLLNPGSSFAQLFQGSALTNFGALITENRENYLVYDGDNLSLRDSTVHFWVKPVNEYYWQGGQRKIKGLRPGDKQVLFSWLGGFEFKPGDESPGTNLRDGGFEIIRIRRGNLIDLQVQIYGLRDRGRFAQTTSTLFSFPVAYVQSSADGEEFYSKSSLWRVGAWNHIQFSFGVDRRNGRYTGTLIVNSQYMPGGIQGLSGTQPPNKGSGVHHAFIVNYDHGVFVEGKKGQSSYVKKWGSEERVSAGVKAAHPNDGYSGSGYFGYSWYVDRLFYDYYYCNADNTEYISKEIDEKKPFKTLEPDEFGQYLPGLGIPDSGLFPRAKSNRDINYLNREVVVRFKASRHSPENPTIPGEESCYFPNSHKSNSHNSSHYPINSEQHPQPTDWYYLPSSTVRDNKLTLMFYRRYTEVKRVEAKRSLYTKNRSFCSNYSLTNRKEPDQFDPPLRKNPTYHCFNRFPVEHGKYTFDQCDDCEGCEACDIDGPIFIGAELSYPDSQRDPNNQGKLPIMPTTSNPELWAKRSPSPVTNKEIDTHKVFHFGECMIDNLYLLGYRVDKNGSDPDKKHLVNMPSDRFYDSEVSQLHSNKANARGHKPGYKRNLTELYGRRLYKLGTVTWTGYPGFNRIPIGEAAPTGSIEANYEVGSDLNQTNLNKTNLMPESLTPVTVSILKWDLTVDGEKTVNYISPPNSQGGVGLSFSDGILSSKKNSAANSNKSYSPLARANRFDPDRGGSGITVLNEVDREIRRGELLILAVDFAPTVAGVGTYQTPLLNDITITYFTEPKTLYTEEGQ